MTNPDTLLKQVFGYDSFRPLQREVIDNVLARRDTLAIMPTGGGKSLCYQIPSLLFPGLTVVVSPLIALMKDQVEQIRAFGAPALFLNSTLSPEAYAENMAYIRRGEVRLLYVAPETLLTPRIFSLLDSVPVDMLTIDEAHCISEWGHDFRPEYRQLVAVRRRYPKAVCLALTATATPRVRGDIQSSLGFAADNEFIASFNRENLYIEVAPKRDPIQQTLRFLQRFKDQSGIIYCFSRRQVDELAAYLAAKGLSALPYHAGLDDNERRRNQEAFIRDDTQIIVATIAFGMGINKPNVRFILHYDLPKSIEGYYQEIGRAGRDGLPAHCLLLYNYGDAAKQRYFIDQKEGDDRRSALQHLDAIVQYAEDESHCRRKPLLAYFGESFTAAKCNNCDNCTSDPPTLADITLPAQKFLSCVRRTGERFGAGHVVDVLRGSRNEKVLRWEHDQLSTFAIGADLSEKQWMHLARQLVVMGYLSQEGEFRTLSLTEKALLALRKRSPIFGQPYIEEQRPRNKEARDAGLDYDAALFSLLRQKRKELADADNVPPYVIFSDKTLVEMAAYFPQTDKSLLQITGVGQVKLRQYGSTFLDLIRGYCAPLGLEERPRAGRAAPPALAEGGAGQPAGAPRRDGALGARTVLVGDAYNDGASISSLAAHYAVTPATILDHLTRYTAAGNPLRASDELRAFSTTPPADQQAALTAFSALGGEYLKPVYEKLEGRVNYDELKILRLLFWAEGAPRE